ncbi:DMT family transporter [Helicobacter sp. 11S02629-2]|uniref:DMT family transporter n=1 Tax=Helicobacter sp. 11S02629-2 TaxID=1476195 RepID=UPI000BA6D592|nr:DMT family transporter [Helicobacter sp. 11S02629-2]PAF44948.1 hypothetical protein BKH40_04480 [Helicobacter sp. 11S02629-2]
MISSTTKGISFMLLSSFSFALMSAAVKLLSDEVSPMETVFWRSFIMVLFTIAVMSIPTKKDKPKQEFKKGGKLMLAFRAIIGGLAMLAGFYNIYTIPLGTAIAFQQSVPIYVVFFSLVFLRECLGIGVIIATIIGFIGIVLISDPKFGGIHPLNIFAGVISGMFSALGFMTLGKLKAYFRSQTVVLAFGATATLIGLIGMFLPLGNFSDFLRPSLKGAVLIIFMGLTGTIAQFLLNMAYRSAPAGIVGPIDYTRILWSLLFGILLGDALPNSYTSIGIALIIISGLMIAMPSLLRDLRAMKFKKDMK